MFALLAFLCGLSVAPYTHAHHTIHAVSDAHHQHGDTLVHTHASPHAHGDADRSAPSPAEPDEDEQIWTVNSFVFEQAVPSPVPSPVLLLSGDLHVPLVSVWLGADRPQPKSHGTPVGPPSGLRAPPAFLPTFV